VGERAERGVEVASAFSTPIHILLSLLSLSPALPAPHSAMGLVDLLRTRSGRHDPHLPVPRTNVFHPLPRHLFPSLVSPFRSAPPPHAVVLHSLGEHTMPDLHPHPRPPVSLLRFSLPFFSSPSLRPPTPFSLHRLRHLTHPKDVPVRSTSLLSLCSLLVVSPRLELRRTSPKQWLLLKSSMTSARGPLSLTKTSSKGV
jgi:hypothetical protein